ncbi:phasin family protein [Chitinimonas arctica]|uniref:Phasin family protein n=1 Tax=Chitinimonas arctica TaxID=2594795 RepID=A0A516SAM2_9NEIS|nr:phasin family protein [Chitinimonas arctica]QDQ25199.1 phasin family protein [Chitinimonas arctica]
MTQAPYSDLAQQQMELALKVARIGIDSTERLLKLQLGAAKEALEDSARTAARLSEVKDPQSAMAVRAELTEQAMGNMLGLSRNIYELAAQTQAELAQLSEIRSGNFQQSLMSNFDRISKATPAGSDILSASLKSSVAAGQAAFDSLNKAARQVAEFADTSLKAASTATAEAVKNVNREKA